MKKYYPTNRPQNRPNQTFPVVAPRISLPQAYKTLTNGSRHANHNVAGQTIVYIEMEDKYGNKVRMKSKNQVLDLLDGAKGNWFVGDGGGRTHRPKRRKKKL